MKIVHIIWTDACTRKDGVADNIDDNPLVYLNSIGALIGEFKDKNGTEFTRICHKKALEGSDGNDDWTDIPSSCIKKMDILGDIDE